MKRIPLVAASLVFLVHIVANPHYGFFRDELYFIICGRHPDFGYVDQPPIVPLLAAGSQLFGHSLFLLRLVPALFAAGGAYVTCLLVREFGGGRFAEVLAALTFALCPVLAAFGQKVGTDEVGLLGWPLVALCIVRIVRFREPRLWLVAGAAAGISFEGKYSVVFYVAALVAGLLATKERRALRTPWFAGGVAVMLAIALPNVIWQLREGLPMLELLKNGQLGKNTTPSVPLYLAQELLVTNPLLALEWIVGLVWLATRPPFRFLAVAYACLIGEMLVFHGKHYYPANVYPVLIAAGAVPIEAWTARLRFARPALLAYAAIAGACFLPDVLPVLPENAYIAFADERASLTHVSFKKAIETEHGREDSLLEGDYADMHGWPEMATAVASVYASLSPRERAKVVVFAGNYGEASAVAFFEPAIPVISEHNQYWLWGPRGYTGSVVIQINGSCFHDDRLFGSRRRVRTLTDRYAAHFESGIPIWICRDPKRSLAQIWPGIKDYE